MIATCEIPHRVVSPDVLAAMRQTNPIEAAAAEILIQRGDWSLKSEGGKND